MGKRLTYEQRVRRKFPQVYLWIMVSPRRYNIGYRMQAISGNYSRPRDAWRSAWRNLKGRK